MVPLSSSSLSILSRILRDFPLLVPTSRCPPSLVLHGYLETVPTRVPITITFPHGPHDLRSSSVSTSSILQETLAPNQIPTLRRLLSTSPDAHAFLVELRSVIHKHSSPQKNPQQVPASKRNNNPLRLQNAAFYERILNEAQALGWSRVDYISPTLNQLTIAVTTSTSPDDKITSALDITYPPDYPKDPIQIACFLPEPFTVHQDEPLSILIPRYEQAMRRWIPFWKVMEDFDKHCLVLEPEHPRHSDTWRRIVLSCDIDVGDGGDVEKGKKRKKKKKRRKCCVSMNVEIDPRNPRKGIPVVRFMGNESQVSVLRQRFNEGLIRWDDNLMPRANLERILQVEYVKRNERIGGDEGDGLEVGDGECAICYSWRLEGQVPDVACEKDSCARPFHRSCLIEWLKALPDTRQSFHTLFGQCPYCSTGISVKTDAGY